MFHERNENDVAVDVEDALKDFKYMKDFQDGKVTAKQVFEQEMNVIEHYWSCSLPPPNKAATTGWIENKDLHLYAAYVDTRENSLFPNNNAVQILIMSWRTLERRQRIYCNIYGSRKHAVVAGFVREIWQRIWDPRDPFYVPNLITCPIPNRMRGENIEAVSLSYIPCEPQSKTLLVTNPPKETQKQGVAVCVKGIDFKEEISHRLVEWIEALKYFGVSRIMMYTYSMSNQTQNVLQYYKKAGLLESVDISLPGDSPTLPLPRSQYIWRNRQQKRRHELIPYNDCLYRHLYTHKYILIIDTDELIVPLIHDDYNQMLDAIVSNHKHSKISSISLRNVFKFPDNTTANIDRETLYLFANKRRSRKTSDPRSYGKSFTSTDNVASVFNHFALHRLQRYVAKTIYVNENVGVKLHYKIVCPIELQKDCEELRTDMIVDTALDKHEIELRKRINKAIAELWQTKL